VSKAYCSRHYAAYETAEGCEDCRAMPVAKPEAPRCEAGKPAATMDGAKLNAAIKTLWGQRTVPLRASRPHLRHIDGHCATCGKADCALLASVQPATATVTAIDRDAGVITYTQGTKKTRVRVGRAGDLEVGDAIAASASDGWSVHKSEQRAANEAYAAKMAPMRAALADMQRQVDGLWKRIEEAEAMASPAWHLELDAGLKAWLPQTKPESESFFGVDASIRPSFTVVSDWICPPDSAYMLGGKLFMPPSMESVFVMAAERARAEPFPAVLPTVWVDDIDWGDARADHADAMRHAAQYAARAAPKPSVVDRNERAYTKALDSGLQPPWARLPDEPVLAWAQRSGVDLSVYGGDAWPYGSAG
jgi:hypothetical protein